MDDAKEARAIVWISGATSGIGEALAATVLFEPAQIISLSPRPTTED